MNEYKLELFWNDIPIGKDNATDYPTLCALWRKAEREVRAILHDLSLYDNGDDYILVRSARGKGFYRTDDAETMKLYRQECLNKGRSIFAPVKKINRVLSADAQQYHLQNNLRLHRERCGLRQTDVCVDMQTVDPAFDNSLLSKMENGVCLPTYAQLAKLAQIYGVEAGDLISSDFYF